MKQESNNEIDLLLRRMSRRDGISARDGEAQNAAQHLDVDELSSYAQNALPVAARARYTEHLAECSPCRKLVSELSLSLGAAAATQPVETVSEASGWKKFLAALFSPMVLRYAVPALGVIVVMVVGFVVLRQQQRKEFVAQVDHEQKQPTPASPSAEAPSPDPSVQSGVGDLRETKSGNAQRPAAKPNESASGTATGATDAIAPAAPVTAPREEKYADAAPAPAATPPPPPAAAKTANSEGEAQNKAEATTKRVAQPAVGTADAEVRKEKANEAASDNSRRGLQTTRSARAAKDKPAAAPETQTLAGGATASQSRDRSDKDVSDTRSVAGRRFRKARGIWIDTAYDSSTATVNVARGSEQFRALVADEPGIKTIAEQLDGEVIVVWKGRAYRIR